MNDSGGGNPIIQDSLLAFLQSKVPSVKKDEIDDIVLSYVTSVLEELSESTFDSTDFCELLFAYIPSVEGAITPEQLTEWIFELAEQQRQLSDKKGSHNNIDLKVILETTNKSSVIVKKNPDQSPSSSRKSTRYSGTSDGGSEHSLEGEEFSSTVDHLVEMFPYACTLEVAHCLTLSGGDIERAAHLIMHRQETEQALTADPRRKVNPNKKPEMNEKDIKEKILGKYGFVDQAEDARYHRPSIKKTVTEDKKLIRYRDGKIVSTKGERFTQVTKAESEEMKKSYVNIKT